MHQRSLQLDNERLPGRVRAHIDGLVREEEEEYRNLDLTSRLRNAMGRLGDVLGSFGWGIGGMGNTGGNASTADGWGRPTWGGPTGAYTGQANAWRRGPWGGRGRGRDLPPENFGPAVEEDERPLDLPEAPPWQVSFTHPGKMPHGFTSDFAPVEPELIVLEDSDEESKKRKGKGKARRPPEQPDVVPRQTLMLVCTKCKDPLLLGGEKDDERVYGLRCGHVLDGKCLWKLAKPSEPNSQPNASNTQKGSKGKARAAMGEEQPRTGIDPSYKFTFVPPEASYPLPTLNSTVYQEDNSPSAAPILPRVATRLRRGIVSRPNDSMARRTRGQARRNALDGVHDEITPEPPQGPSTPQLDLSDPFFPTMPNAPQRGGGGARVGRGSGNIRGGKRTKMRKVPKTRGKLKEEVFEWQCPVSGCGRDHVSVRLDMEGAKWKCDATNGAILMFL